MRIKELKTYILSQELQGKSFCYSQAWYSSRTILILEIITEDGISGWGESFGNAFINKSIIDRVYSPLIIGENIFDTEKIWDTLYNCMRDHGQKGCVIEAISAIDIALWDLKGKYTNMPIWRLLGGARRERVMPYATGLYRTHSEHPLNDLIEEAEQYVEQGFRAVKLKVGFGLQNDIQTVRAIRKTVGDNIDLMIDANHAYNATTALQLARELEPYHIAWFEEPVPPENLEGYVELRRFTSIPIAGGEAEFTRYGFKRLLDIRGVDILQPDCCVTGGFSEFMKISAMASLQQIQVYPHIWGSAIALQAGIHCAFSIPNYPDALIPHTVFLELDRTPNIFRDCLAKEKHPIRDGWLYLSEGNGLGIEIDRELMASYLLEV